VELGVHTPERRAFLPHVTVARRVRGPAGGPVAGSAGGSVAGPAASARFVLPSVTLYRSRLSRAGARYEAVHRAPLP
jgi:2'-5' RNA ligase